MKIKGDQLLKSGQGKTIDQYESYSVTVYAHTLSKRAGGQDEEVNKESPNWPLDATGGTHWGLQERTEDTSGSDN